MCVCKHSKEAHYDDYFSSDGIDEDASLGECFWSYNCDCKEYKATGE